MNNLEKALNSPKFAKKLQQEVSEDVEAQKKEVQEEIERKKLLDEANRIVNEGKTETYKPKYEEGSVRQLGAGKKTPAGKITPRGHRSVTRKTAFA